jgi:hypothetical protein
MREYMGWQRLRPALSFVTIPGRISTSIPRRNTPMRMDPPATPPLSSSTSAPGLFTSKERITISRGSDVKSRMGIGMHFTMYSFTASMLYLSCAEIGTMGDDSATVPGKGREGGAALSQILSEEREK